MSQGGGAARLRRLVSGGQTGVDRAALDVALELGLPVGGWCPRGRLAEDGPLPERYPLEETPSQEYPQRTEWNVRDSDGTLVLTRGRPSGGTRLTVRLAAKLEKPCLVLDLEADPDPSQLRAWLAEAEVAVLNVAGPRASGQPGIHEQAARWLRRALEERR